jgi:hypothetical protein
MALDNYRYELWEVIPRVFRIFCVQLLASNFWYPTSAYCVCRTSNKMHLLRARVIKDFKMKHLPEPESLFVKRWGFYSQNEDKPTLLFFAKAYFSLFFNYRPHFTIGSNDFWLFRFWLYFIKIWNVKQNLRLVYEICFPIFLVVSCENYILGV